MNALIVLALGPREALFMRKGELHTSKLRQTKRTDLISFGSRTENVCRSSSLLRCLKPVLEATACQLVMQSRKINARIFTRLRTVAILRLTDSLGEWVEQACKDETSTWLIHHA